MNPVDVVATGVGNSIVSSTSAVTTNNAADLLFAANLVETATWTPGAGFTNRMITNPDGGHCGRSRGVVGGELHRDGHVEYVRPVGHADGRLPCGRLGRTGYRCSDGAQRTGRDAGQRLAD